MKYKFLLCKKKLLMNKITLLILRCYVFGVHLYEIMVIFVCSLLGERGGRMER